MSLSHRIYNRHQAGARTLFWMGMVLLVVASADNHRFSWQWWAIEVAAILSGIQYYSALIDWLDARKLERRAINDTLDEIDLLP